jgi:hypothetical protein
MTLGEMVKILTMISAYYPTFNNGRDPEVTSKAWHLLFENDSFQAVQSALLSYVATDVKGFPPMPGALKDLMKPKVSEVSAFEAWHEVKKALSNGIYGSKEEFEKLSPICKRIVGSPAVLREWATLDSDELDTVVSSNFQRNYRAISENTRNYEKLPERVRQMLPGFDSIGLYGGDSA